MSDDAEWATLQHPSSKSSAYKSKNRKSDQMMANIFRGIAGDPMFKVISDQCVLGPEDFEVDEFFLMGEPVSKRDLDETPMDVGRSLRDNMRERLK